MKKVFIFITITLMAFAAGFVSTNSVQPLSVGSFTQFLPKIEIIPAEIKPTSLTLVGDVLLARRVETYLDAYGSQYVYASLPKISSTTVLIGNFEASIPEKHIQTPDLTFSFSVDTVHIPALAEYGFQYMSLANNHSFDKGQNNFLHTQQVLEKNEVHTFGSPVELGTTSVTYIDLADQMMALVGVYAVNQVPSAIEIEKLFKKASAQSDIQIAYVHWGVEYQAVHSVTQRQLAHILVDAGADTVIGHHPHVVQDIELYEGVPIFYSMGNFIFDQYFSAEVQEGLWVELKVGEDTLVYTLQGITSIGSRSVPRFMTAYENDLFLNALARKSTKSLSEQIQNGKIVQ